MGVTVLTRADGFVPVVRLIPIEQANALAIKHPAITAGSIPQGSYRGNPPLPDRDQPTAMVERMKL